MARKSRDDVDVVQEAHKRFKSCNEKESGWRQRAADDMKFVEGDSYNNNQWPTNVSKSRGDGRPMLTINKTKQHCLQIINDAAQNQMGIKVNATGFGSTADAADAIEGIIRHIEYASNATQNAYKRAIDGQVKIGIGWIHITSDYMPGRSFDQELKIKSVPNPLNVYSDPTCLEPDHSDMQWAMLGEDLTRDAFDLAYPGHKDLDGVQAFGDGQQKQDGWVGKDLVRVMRYYRRSEKQETIWAIPANLAAEPGAPPPAPGSTQIVSESSMSDETIELAHLGGWPTRKITVPKVEWYVIAGSEIIDQGDTVFDHIPLVPFVGEEVEIDGDLDRKGHVRALLDPQRMYNYSSSRYIEFVALQARSPFMADARAIEGHETDWENANSGTPPAVLVYNATSLDDSTIQIPTPVRIDPPSVDAASLQGMQQADQQMQMVSGQYEASLGAQGNEKSGTAIQQRQRQGERATYHFIDGQGAALRLAGKIIVGAIPKVYDRQRAVQILGLDGERQGIIVDPGLTGADGNPIAHKLEQPPQVPATPTGPGPSPQPARVGGATPTQPAPDPNDPNNPLKAILAINPTIGTYDVEADVGPSFATRRQDGANVLLQILAADPSLRPIIGDLLFQSMDFPLHDEIAERLKRMVPPQALSDGDPALAGLQQQNQALTQHLQTALEALADAKKKTDIDQQEADAKTAALEIDQYKAETDRLSALGSIDQAAMIPVIRGTVQQALVDRGIGGAVQVAHPHDASLGGPPNGMMAPGMGIQPIPPTDPPGGAVRGVPAGGQ